MNTAPIVSKVWSFCTIPFPSCEGTYPPYYTGERKAETYYYNYKESLPELLYGGYKETKARARLSYSFLIGGEAEAD